MGEQPRPENLVSRFDPLKGVGKASAQFGEGALVHPDIQRPFHGTVNFAQIIQAVSVVRMGVGIDHGIQRLGSGLKQLFAQVG